MLCFLVFGSIQSQTTFTYTVASDGNDKTMEIPFGLFDKASCNQVLYTSADLGALRGVNLTGIQFYADPSTTTKSFTAPARMSLGYTQNADMSAGTFVSSTETEVYAATWTFPEMNMNSSMTFTTPFLYDGMSNLLLTVRRCETASNYNRFYTYGKIMESERSIFYNKDALTYSCTGFPTEVPTISKILPKTTFSFTTSANDVAVSDLVLPLNIIETIESSISVTVYNFGNSALVAGSAKLQLCDQNNNVVLDNIAITDVAVGANGVCNFKYIPAEGSSSSITSLHVKIVYAADENQNNNITANKNIVPKPYNVKGVFSIKELPFDILTLDQSITSIKASFTYINTGTAEMSVTDITTSTGFSVATADKTFTLAPGANKTIAVTFTPSSAGRTEGSLTMVFTGEGDKVLNLHGIKQKDGDLYESFENAAEFPPFMWVSVNGTWQRNTNQAYKGTAAARENSSTLDTLIPPALNVASGDKISFFAKHYNNSASELKILYSTNKTAWTELASYKSSIANDGNKLLPATYQYFEVAIPTTGKGYIAFVGNSDVMVDYVYGPAAVYPQKDIRVMADGLNIPKFISANRVASAAVKLRKQGTNSVMGAKIEWVVKNSSEQETVLGSYTLTANDEMTIKEERVFSVSCVPVTPGTYSAFIRVVYEGDEDVSNNISATSAINVITESAPIISIGAENSAFDEFLFWKDKYNYAFGQVLYYAQELGLSAGSQINEFSFYYKNTAQGPWSRNLKVWIGETDADNITSWVELSKLTQVYSANTSFTNNGNAVNEWKIQLATPYTYTGKNLVVMIERERKVNDYPSNLTFQRNTDTVMLKRRAMFRQDLAITLTEGLSKPASISDGAIQTISIVATTTLSNITGTVHDKDDAIVSGAKVILENKERGVYYETTTTENGTFSVSTAFKNGILDLSILSEGKFFVTRQITVDADANTELGVLKMSGQVYTYDLTIDLPDAGSAAGSVITLTGTTQGNKQTVNIVEGTNTYSLTNLIAEDYTLTIVGSAYKHLSKTFTISNTNVTETITLEAKPSIALTGIIKNKTTSFVMSGVEVKLYNVDAADGEEALYTATTNSEGVFSITTNKVGKTYKAVCTKASYISATFEIELPDTEMNYSIPEILYMDFDLNKGMLDIGTAESTAASTIKSSPLPLCVFYFHSAVQTIYTKTELAKMTGKQIKALKYSFVGTPNAESELKIYMAYTDKDEYSGAGDSFIELDQQTLVYNTNGNPLKYNSAEITLDLQTPFAYNGEKNLIVTVARSVRAQKCGNIEMIQTDTSVLKRTLYMNDDNTTFTNLSDIPEAKKKTTTARANVQFIYQDAPAVAIADFSPQTIDFGSVEVGQHSADKVANLCNLGSVAINGATTEGLTLPFSVKENIGELTITGGAKTPLNFVFSPTQEGIFNATVNLNVPNGVGSSISLSGFAYPAGTLYEGFENEDSIPVLFRTRTSNFIVKNEIAGAYEGSKYLSSTSDLYDTLIMPKVKGGALSFMLKDADYSTKDMQVLYSSDLVRWTVLKKSSGLSFNATNYTSNQVDLSSIASDENPVFIALAGYRFFVDNIMITKPVRPVKDLYLTSISVRQIALNEKSNCNISVKVRNWGTETANSYKIVIKDQNGKVLQESEQSQGLAYKAEKMISITWAAVAGVESLRAEVVITGDEDATNNSSIPVSISVTPYKANGVIIPKILDFSVLLSEKNSDTMSVKFINNGIADMTVTGVDVTKPYTIVENLPITIAAGDTSLWRIVFNRTGMEAGVYNSDLKFKFDGIGDSVLSLKGILLKEDCLFESFESTSFPPFLWRTTKNIWEGHDASSLSFHGNVSARESSSSNVDTLITPRLEVVASDKISFYARDWNSGRSRLKVLKSADLVTWEELGVYEGDAEGGNATLTNSMTRHELNLTQGTYYIGFVGKSDVLLDYIIGPKVKYAANDIALTSSSIPQKAKQNNTIKWSATVKNMASQTASSYKIELMQNSEVLSSHSAREDMSLAFKTEKTFEFAYTPTSTGLMENLYVNVIMDGDEDISNNKGTIFSISVVPENEGESLIGTVGDNTDGAAIWAANYKYSLYEVLYYPNELNIENGSFITSISIPVSANDISPVPFNVNIWIGETDKTEITDTWIEASTLTKVAASHTINIPANYTGKLDIPFSTQYTYNGNTLVILVERQWKDTYQNHYQYVNSDAQSRKRRAFYKVDGSQAPAYDPTGNIPFAIGKPDTKYPTIEFKSIGSQIEIKGKIVIASGNAVEGAKVNLSSESLSYNAITDADGAFTIRTSAKNIDLTLSVVSESGFFAPRTINVASANIDLGNLTLIEKAYNYTVFVKAPKTENGALNLGGLKAVLQNTKVENERFTKDLQTSYAKDTASLRFEMLNSGSYTLSLTHADYSSFVKNEIVIIDADINDTVQLVAKTPINVKGKILSSLGNLPLKGVAVAIALDGVEGAVSLDTTTEDGMYSLPVSKFGRLYTITYTHPSYQISSKPVLLWQKEQDTTLSNITLLLKNLVAVVNVSVPNSGDPSGAAVSMTLTSDINKVYTGVVANGKVIIDNMLPGLYSLSVSKENYVTYNSEVEMISGLNLSVVLNPTSLSSSFNLHISTNNGGSAEGTGLYMEDTYTGLVHRAVADAKGDFMLQDLAKGTYILELYKKGYDIYKDEAFEIAGDIYDTLVLQEIIVAPYALTAEVKYSEQTGKAQAKLTWNEIGEYYFDSYEDYQDFSLSFDNWTLIDNDKKGTASVNNVSYPHAGEAMAAMVFNPYTTVPVCTDASFKPSSGNKYMVFFGSVGAPNDDWAISPKRMVRDGDILQFVCRQLTNTGVADRLTVSVSEKGTAIENFEMISEGNYISISGSQWSVFEADLSMYVGKEINIGLHCISSGTGNMLMIDDFFVGSTASLENKNKAASLASAAGEPLYFNVYKNGSKIDTSHSTSYLFSELKAGDYVLGVSAVYASSQSDTSVINVTVADYAATAAHLTVNVSTNTSESADGATISMVSMVGSQQTYNYTVANGKIDLPYFPKGEYRLNVTFDGFEIHTENVNITADKILSVSLIEKLSTPINPYVVVTPNADKLTAKAAFSWNENVGFNESFEGFADFTQKLTTWQNIDKDKLKTFGLSNCNFPGMQGEMAGMVFNPWSTTPPTNSDALILPTTGKKEIIFIGSDLGAANDWLIAPKQEIRDNYIISFFAKSYSSAYLESMLVWVAEAPANGSMPNEKDFVKVASLLDIPAEWKEFTVDLKSYAGKSIYVAFNYVSNNKFFMLLDDIHIGPKQNSSLAETSRVLKYKVYLNGVLKTETKDNSYLFEGLTPGDYKAEVEALYKSGVSPKASYNFKVTITDNEDEQKAAVVSIYPNPVGENSDLNIKANEPIVCVKIMNISGREILKEYGKGSLQMSLPLGNISNGAYMVEITTENSSIVKKLIVR